MGMYLSLATAVLRRRDDGFEQQTQIYHFEQEVYIAWCRPPKKALPPGWTTLADGTLRIQRPPDQWGHTVSMDTNPVDPADEPGRFTYAELLDLGDPSALLHLVLPPNYLPQAGTIRPFPTYARPDGDRLVMGWVWRPGVWTRFQFGPLAPAQFGAAANRVRRRVTQGQQAALESEQELQSIETQLRIWYGNRRLLEEQKAQFGLEIPLRLHNELANANAQIEALAARRAAVTGQYGAG